MADGIGDRGHGLLRRKAGRAAALLSWRAVPPFATALASRGRRRPEVLLPLAALSVWTIGELLAEDDQANADAAVDSQDEGSRYGVLGAHLVAWWLPVVIGPRARSAARRRMRTAVGVGLIMAGGALRIAAVHTLGTRFTGHVRVSGDQQVCSTGPYALVRHPSYVGLFGLNAGPAISCGSPAATLIMTTATALAAAYRIRVEERLLVDRLGPAYLEYSARVPRFVPALRSATVAHCSEPW